MKSAQERAYAALSALDEKGHLREDGGKSGDDTKAAKIIADKTNLPALVKCEALLRRVAECDQGAIGVDANGGEWFSISLPLMREIQQALSELEKSDG